MTVIRRIRNIAVLTASTFLTLALIASPVGAQQLVDAGEPHGGGATAFVLFTALVGLTFAVLFAMDRIRRRREAEREREGQR
jgi:uncharacterized membrane protein